MTALLAILTNRYVASGALILAGLVALAIWLHEHDDRMLAEANAAVLSEQVAKSNAALADLRAQQVRTKAILATARTSIHQRPATAVCASVGAIGDAVRAADRLHVAPRDKRDLP